MLAYSTISQIGYMFLALGVGAWAAAIFHFITHAFFKALLFLAAGVVIEALHHEHDIFHMGGLRRRLPLAFWTFLAGGASLAGLPLVTAGFYSKDLIIWSTWTSPRGAPALWALAIAGVLLTSLYTFRLIFLVFFGPRAHAGEQAARRGGADPAGRARPCWRSPEASSAERFLAFHYRGAAAARRIARGRDQRAVEPVTSALAFAFGLLFAYVFYMRRRDRVPSMATAGLARALHRLWQADWGFDWLYDRLFVRPFLWLASANQDDFVDAVYNGMARAAQLAWAGLSATQTGRVRWYAAGIAGGAVLFLAIVLLV